MQRPSHSHHDEHIEMHNVYNAPQARDEEASKSLMSGMIDETKLRRSNNVQKVTVVLVVAMVAMLIVIIGVTSATFRKVKRQFVYSPSITTVYDSVGLPGYEGLSWADIETAGAGSTVNFYAWSDGGGDWDDWVEKFLTPQLSELYDINLVYHKLSDTVDAVIKIEYEAKHYSTTNGSVDMIWINLENFARLKNGGNLYGPWVTKVPNAVNFDFSDTSVAYDGGIPIGGYEFPYNGAQVAFFYNTKRINSTTDVTHIKSIDGIKTWLKSNPGKFTYAAPARDAESSNYDFTGAAFVRHVFYALGGPYTDFLGQTTVNTALYNKRAPAVFKFLREIEPYLYTAPGLYGKNNTYPASNNDVDDLFGNEDVWLTLSYDPLYADGQIADGKWPSYTQGYCLSMGTIANTNYIAIPNNAKHKLAAVLATNFIGSAAAMFYRAAPTKLGALQVYDPSSSTFTTGGWQVAFDTIDWPASAPAQTALSSGRLGELAAAYIDKIQQDWYYCVYNYTASTAPSYCG